MHEDQYVRCYLPVYQFAPGLAGACVHTWWFFVVEYDVELGATKQARLVEVRGGRSTVVRLIIIWGLGENRQGWLLEGGLGGHVCGVCPRLQLRKLAMKCRLRVVKSL